MIRSFRAAAAVLVPSIAMACSSTEDSPGADDARVGASSDVGFAADASSPAASPPDAAGIDAGDASTPSCPTVAIRYATVAPAGPQDYPFDAENRPATPPSIGDRIYLIAVLTPDDSSAAVQWELFNGGGGPRSSLPAARESSFEMNQPGIYLARATVNGPCAARSSTALDLSIPAPGPFAWTRVTNRNEPSREAHAMAYDSRRDRVVMFGGGGGVGGVFNGDTWEFDGTQWRSIDTPTSPGWIYYHAMAYDWVRRTTVMFAGDGEYFGSDGIYTHEFDGTTWRPVPTDHQPPRAAGYRMVYDPFRRRLVMVGADRATQHWEIDGADWIPRRSANFPPPRRFPGLAFDVVRRRVVLFGGWSNRTPLNDTWEFNGLDWREVQTSTRPPPSGETRMVYDSARQRVVLFRSEQANAPSDLT